VWWPEYQSHTLQIKRLWIEANGPLDGERHF
jgi:hypothetical protein